MQAGMHRCLYALVQGDSTRRGPGVGEHKIGLGARERTHNDKVPVAPDYFGWPDE